MITDFSKEEIKLFKSFGCETLLTNCAAFHAYRYLTERVFIENLSGPNVEALRRGYSALCDLSCLRKTSEFNSLISF